MTRFIYNVASFEAASGVAGRIVDYSSAFITEMAERTGWVMFLVLCMIRNLT